MQIWTPVNLIEATIYDGANKGELEQSVLGLLTQLLRTKFFQSILNAAFAAH